MYIVQGVFSALKLSARPLGSSDILNFFDGIYYYIFSQDTVPYLYLWLTMWYHAKNQSKHSKIKVTDFAI